jgi:hypothetical protein
VKEITLTQGKTTMVDDVDFEILSKFKWAITNKGYAKRTIRIDGKLKTILLHRVIMGVSEENRHIFVDHIDRDPLNNTKSNLRVCNHMQNQWNKEKMKAASSKYKGVSWDNKYKKWRVTISIDGKGKNGGRYETEEAAAKAYNELALKLRGEFARLNAV